MGYSIATDSAQRGYCETERRAESSTQSDKQKDFKRSNED